MRCLAMKANGVSYSRGGKWLVRSISLQIDKGEMVAIVGPNGAGKTTLLRLLAGVLQPSEGDVFCGSEALDALPRRDVARRLAYVPQDTSAQFEISVREAVALGRFSYVGVWRSFSSADWDVIDDSIESMELTHLMDRRLPTLSGGERQRVYLARALAQKSPILLLDEPTSALDIGHQLELIAKLTDLNSQRQTIIAAMHDLPMCWSHFERVALLRDGRLVCDGPAHDVLLDEQTAHTFGVSFSSHDNRLIVE